MDCFVPRNDDFRVRVQSLYPSLTRNEAIHDNFELHG